MKIVVKIVVHSGRNLLSNCKLVVIIPMHCSCTCGFITRKSQRRVKVRPASLCSGNERLNGVNRQPSSGQKFYRPPSKKGKFYCQPSGSPRGIGEQGNMVNFSWGSGEQRQNILGNKGTKIVLGNTGTKGSEREGQFLCTHVVNIFVSKSVCMELRQWLNWGMSLSYEFTLGGWMLSKSTNKLVGRRNIVVCEIAVTTYYIDLYTEYGTRKSGADRGVVRSNFLN